MEDYIFQIRKELRGLKLTKAFITLCDEESISSQATTYKALEPDTFNLQSAQHRQIIRRAIRYLHTQGSLLDMQPDDVCPESLVPASTAA